MSSVSLGSSAASLGEPSSSLKDSSTECASVSPYSSPDLKSLTAALGSKSSDAQIRALKKLKLDVQLCRCLAAEDKCVAHFCLLQA